MADRIVDGKPTSGPKPTHPYFVDQRKGEVNELRQLLRNLNIERDPQRKRDIIKKVIAYMTLGIDVSRLFTEMIMAIETKDLVVKKMVYLYLCNYAHAKPDMAIMAINTLLRDCQNEDPMVRGLALRSLCSLRLPTVIEYVQEPLQRSLLDLNGYVRKTAVMGVLKLHHLAPAEVARANLVDALYNMIRDPDAQVVTNCLVALNEIMAGEGGISNNRAIIFHLLTRLQDFNEWGLIQVLGMVAEYQPQDEDEMFSIMNLLDPFLRTSNAGVVLSIIHCFLNLTAGAQDLQSQVYERVKAPLLTLMAGSIPELTYTILKHVEVLIDRCPGVFDDDFRLFYTRYDEPTPVKYSKVGLLARMANGANVIDIVGELGEYVADVDATMARHAICAIGQIAVHLPDGVPSIFEKLIEFLELNIDYVRSQTVLVMKDLLRKYPERRMDVLPHLSRCLRKIDEPEGKAAVIWMVGEYGEELIEAPYMLEPLIDRYSEEQSIEVRISLLTAAMKLFFKRPPEMQLMLGRLLASAVNDNSSQDLHDRALLYFRLLQGNVDVAKHILSSSSNSLHTFAEEIDSGFKENIFREFNSLSVLYGKTADQFVSDEYKVKKVRKANPPSMDSHLDENGDGSNSVDLEELSQVPTMQEPQPVPALAAMVDLLAFDDPLPTPSNPPPVNSLDLVLAPTLDGETFQSLWTSLPIQSSTDVHVLRLPDQSGFESLLQEQRVFIMASGDLPDLMKFFVYAQDTLQNTYLAQIIVQKENKTINMTFKTSNHSADIPSHQILVQKIKTEIAIAYC